MSEFFHLRRVPPAPASMFSEHRKRVGRHLTSGGLALVNSQDPLFISGDGVLPYRQNSDFFYLTGIFQEDSALILFPDAPKDEWKEILFVQEAETARELWEGKKLRFEEAHILSGIRSIRPISTFKQVFHQVSAHACCLYLNQNEHYRSQVEAESREDRFVRWCMEKYPLFRYERLAPLLLKERMVKSDEEIMRIRKACLLTERGFRRALDFVRPGVKEYEIEAEWLHEFVRCGSSGFAYNPIVASGKNACYLHYNYNNKVCEEGEVVLMDVGAEYDHYASDLTRCVPVGARFTQRQAAVYEAVLRVMQLAKGLLKPGVKLPDYEKEVGKAMQEELLQLGLLSLRDVRQQTAENPAYKRYFMHGTSHHLGLDTHDLADLSIPLEPNMVLTVEPGIYVPKENLGIRLENDVVIRAHGVEDLMDNVPLSLDEIAETTRA